MNKAQLVEELDRRIARARRESFGVDAPMAAQADVLFYEALHEAVCRRYHTAKPGPKQPVTIGTQNRVERVLIGAEKAVLELMRTYDGDWATMEIVDNVELAERTTKNALTDLARDGYIERIRRGFYRIPD